jgi:hypothetical protein
MRGVDVLLGIPAANVGGVAHAADGMIPATGANGRAGQVCSGVKDGCLSDGVVIFLLVVISILAQYLLWRAWQWVRRWWQREG